MLNSREVGKTDQFIVSVFLTFGLSVFPTSIKYLVQHKTNEMEQGWDSDVKKYFKKVLNSVFIGLLWMAACVTAGIYYQLAYTAGKPLVYTILFYIGMVISLLFLLRYYYHTWKK